MTDDSSSNLRTLFKGGSIVFGGLVLELGISFLAKVVSARWLDRVSFGSVEIGLTIMGVGSTILLLGLNTGLARNLPRADSDRHKREQFFSALYVSLLASGVIAAMIVAGGSWIAVSIFDDPSLTPILQIFGIGIPLATFTKLVMGGIQGLKLPIPKVTTENILLPLSRFVGIVAFVAAGYGALGISGAYVLSFTITGVVGAYYLFREVGIDPPALPTARRTSKELLTFSAPLMIMGTMSMVLSDIDIFLLGSMRGADEVGVYGVVYPLSKLLTLTISAFGFLFMPLLSEIHAQGETDEMLGLYQSVTKWIALTTVPLFLLLVFFPEWSIVHTFGGKYNDGELALVLLSVGFFSHAIAGPNWNMLTSIGRTRTIMYDNIFIAALNVTLNLILIPYYGFVGAAAATTVSYISLNMMYSVQLYHQNRVHPLSKPLVYPLCASIPIFIVIKQGMETLLSEFVFLPLLVLGVFVPVYAVTALRLGAITSDELMLVLSAEERFGIDLGPLKKIAKWFISE